MLEFELQYWLEYLCYLVCVIVFCSRANGLIESDPVLAETARVNGWKISGWADPLTVPVRDAGGVWWLLDDFGGRYVCDTPEIVA